MQAQRAVVAANIISRMKTQELDAYPLSMALSDLDEYYAAGTIAGALIEIQKTVGAVSTDAQIAKADAIEVKFAPLTDLSRRIQAFWNANPGKRPAIKAWIKENAGGLPFSLFLRSENAPLHSKLIQFLGILP
jgi:hypothetical protein